MPKITQLDRNAAKLLHQRLDAAILASPEIKALCEEYGLVVQRGTNCSFSAAEISVKVGFKLDGVLDPMFVQIANMSGFDPTKPSAIDGSKLVGYGGRGKMPWKFETKDGRAMKCGEAYAKKHWPLAEGERSVATEGNVIAS